MAKEIEKLELTDEIYDNLLAEYPKVIVVGVGEDSYVCRFPNKIEYKAITKFSRDSVGKVGMGERAMSLIVETIRGLIVWPEPEVIAEREEYDGGLVDAIANTFLAAYMTRTEEKKR